MNCSQCAEKTRDANFNPLGQHYKWWQCSDSHHKSWRYIFWPLLLFSLTGVLSRTVSYSLSSDSVKGMTPPTSKSPTWQKEAWNLTIFSQFSFSLWLFKIDIEVSVQLFPGCQAFSVQFEPRTGFFLNTFQLHD